MYECVVNISEGVDAALLDMLRTAAGVACVDVHSDPDHHRSVFTLAHDDCSVVETAARALTDAAVAHLDLTTHSGVHPRFGVVDVVPFVTLSRESHAQAVVIAAAHAYAEWVVQTHEIPCFFYGWADADERTLPDARRDAFRSRTPDRGSATPHPRYGAIAVGARPPMVAINVELESADLDAARSIARAVRARDGGLDGVRALAFPLAQHNHVQVSMNLVDLDATGMQPACSAVAAQAHDLGIEVARIELVGLVPLHEIERCEPWFLDWSGISPTVSVERRVRDRRP